MDSPELLNPLVIVIFPRVSEATRVTIQMVLPKYPKCRVIALSAGELDTANYKSLWNSASDRTLLILREKPENHVETTLSAISILQGPDDTRPLGIILVDSADVPRFEEEKRRRWNQTLAERLHKKYRDLQVVEYASSWLYSPPRLR